MAFHPFRTFQRNQKGCMAGATLLAIISFLFLGVIIQLIDGRFGAGSRISTIAECRHFGKITPRKLEQLRQEQEVLQRFFFVLYEKLADPKDEEKMMALQPLRLLGSRIAQSKDPEQLINTWLISQYAQEEGISPDREDAMNLLKQLTGDYISDAVYDDTVYAIGINHQTVERLLIQHLRWEHSWDRFALSVSAVSPATRWDWYQRLYRQVTIEAAAVFVDSLVDQVGNPSNSQLTALFEKYKTKRYSPEIAESGFIMPMELAFQYVVAEPTQQLLDSISEEEMMTYYEENKDAMFRQPVRPLTEYPELPGMMPGLPGGTMPFPTPGFPTSPGRVVIPTFPTLDENTEGLTLPAPETEGLTLPAPETEGITPPAPETEGIAPPAPETEGIAPPAQDVSPEESANSDELFISRYSGAPNVATRFVSYQTEDEEAVADADPRPEAPADTGEPAPHAPENADEPLDLSILYRPFDEVKDQIRRELALDKAVDALPVIQKKMREYAETYHQHFEQGQKAPPMPDMTAFVAEYGLELVRVPRGDVYAAMHTELARGLQERQQILQMYRGSPLLFDGDTFLGETTLMLYWITEIKPEKRPEKLDDVREMVTKRWKEIEARALALKKAEELEREVKTSGKPLAEAFTGRSDVQVVETEPFTWKTYGDLHPLMAAYQGLSPELAEVRERGVAPNNSIIDNKIIVAPGSDFMETVFSLQIGETGVVFNQPQSVAYIVRVTSSAPSTDSLWEQFQRAHILEYRNAGQREMITDAYEAWLEDIRSKTGFRWVNKPDARDGTMYGD